MDGQSYRIVIPTLGILSEDEDGHRIPVTLPKNATVTCINGTVDGNRLIDVLWEGKTIMMFTQDLRARATPIT